MLAIGGIVHVHDVLVFVKFGGGTERRSSLRSVLRILGCGRLRRGDEEAATGYLQVKQLKGDRINVGAVGSDCSAIGTLETAK